MNTCCRSLQVDCKVKVQHGSSKISGGYTDLLRHDGKLYVSLYRSFSLYSFVLSVLILADLLTLLIILKTKKQFYVL